MGDWVKSWKSLRDNPKTEVAAEALESSGVQADWSVVVLGYLHLLWWWASDHATDGDLSGFTDRQVAKACGWTGDPLAFISALTISGFIDETRSINGWEKYNGALIKRWERDAERKRGDRQIAGKTGPSAGPSAGPSNGRGADCRQDVLRREIDRKIDRDHSLSVTQCEMVSQAPTSAEDRLCAEARTAISGWQTRPNDTQSFATLLATWSEEEIADTVHRLAAHQATTSSPFKDPRLALGKWLKRVPPNGKPKTPPIDDDRRTWQQRYCLLWFAGEGWHTDFERGHEKEAEQIRQRAMRRAFSKEDVLAGRMP